MIIITKCGKNRGGVGFGSGIKKKLLADILIEVFNPLMRKITKNKVVFPAYDIPLKILYPDMLGVAKKWVQSRRDLVKIHSQLEIFFVDMLD